MQENNLYELIKRLEQGDSVTSIEYEANSSKAALITKHGYGYEIEVIQ